MPDAKTVRLPVTDLMDRFGISKTVLYARFKVLKIETFRVGRKAYVDGEQLALLDGLQDYLNAGKSTAEFLEYAGLLTPKPSLPKSVELPNESIAAAAVSPSPAIVSADVHCPLHWTERLRFLEETFTHRWLLSTSQLAELLGLSPMTLARMQECDRNGFQFVRAGMNGSEIAWEVKKPKSKQRPA